MRSTWPLPTLEELEADRQPPVRPEGDVEAALSEVALLWGHSLTGAGWAVCVLALIALAVPGLRGRFSTVGVHRGVTALTVGSGTYLLLNQTAYQTPFSPSAVDGAFTLPFGRSYFLALGVKLALYAGMVVAVMPLIREARRLSGVAGLSTAGLSAATVSTATVSTATVSTATVSTATGAGRHRSEADNPWNYAPAPAASRAGTALAERAANPEGRAGVHAKMRVEAGPRATVTMAALLFAIGMGGIWFCVTLLKYFHELIEASRALS